MMLAILAEKKKKKKLNERCALCPAQKYQRSKLFIPTYGNRDSRPGKIFACRIWNLGIFLTNPKSCALESRIQLSQLESGNIIQVPKTRNLELIQYLESRKSLIPDLLFDCSRVLEYAKIRTVLQSKTILDYLTVITMYFLSGKKEKKLNRLSRLSKKIYHVYLFVLSSVYGHYFQQVVFTHMASFNVNLLEQKKAFTY